METKGWYNNNYLPHCDLDCLCQFITFRLFDSVPKDIIFVWKEEIEFLGKDKDDNWKKSILYNKIATFEDRGYGCCWLKQDKIQKLMETILKYYANIKYDLIEYKIMPNHVHVLIRLYENVSLPNIVHTWKSYSSTKINKLLNRKGKVWMRDYYDRFIRNEKHLDYVINYIRNN